MFFWKSWKKSESEACLRRRVLAGAAVVITTYDQKACTQVIRLRQQQVAHLPDFAASMMPKSHRRREASDKRSSPFDGR
jgi:hypothetical protein